MRGNNRAIGARYFFAHPGNLPEEAMTSKFDGAMRRAISLSELALGLTSPNPIVGAVVAEENGQIIAEGFHKKSGSEHAEIAALNAAGNRARGATLVVTLEPCNHSGKTPPCTDSIIAAGIKRVVFSVADPNQLAAGGAKKLRDSGIEVISDVLKDEVAFSNRAWLKKIRSGAPFISLKLAMSVDGKIAAPDGTSKWITSEESRRDVARLRSECDAIVTGSGTVLADNPSLTVRGISRLTGDFTPTRIILGQREIPGNFKIFDDAAETIHLRSRNLSELVELSTSRNWNRLLIEAGPELSSAFIKSGLVDEVIIYQAPILLGGPKSALDDIGVTNLNSQVRFKITEITRIPGDVDNLRMTLQARSA